ncbi:MAG: helix-turn-helix transcriptional regulator, partial [Phycisphaerales bacterium]|nr:helix-turn-helix transcriptional regulator [Phycisphaerales bacterium]
QPPYHRCAFGHTCVLMPLVVNGECVAHCKLALEDDAETNRYLELLDVLAENFSAHLTGQVSSPETPVTNPKHIDPDSHDPIVDPMDDGWTDPVHQALTLIDAEYANPDLTVATVARRLGLNRDYLSHLFRSQTGRRMSRQIFLRRMQQARSMLRSTSLQVRQIALASGFLNTDWFSHTFHELEGVTPSEYRRQSHLR